MTVASGSATETSVALFLFGVIMVFMKKKSVLVTGALGHIGSRLVREISPEVGEVRMLDNMEAKRFPSLYDLPKGRKYTFVEADIRTANFDELLKGVDVVIHLAALSEAEKSVEYKNLVEEVNIKGLKRVVEACLKNKVRLIFPSTTSVYGDKIPLVSETGEISPQSPYADSKFRGEELIRSYSLILFPGKWLVNPNQRWMDSIK